MNGDDIQSREVGSLIEHIEDVKGVKGCEVHQYMVQGCIKSLRMGEASLKLHRWSLAVGIMALISIWLKGSPVGELAKTLLHSIVKL
jgi:hypothetical protein